ncbi:MAG: hypothetical protein IAE99_06635 [Rhodothermales bacterium]|nr:hypothetical protein [Rhodothermales bacterium]
MRRLVQRLASPRASFEVHVDARVDATPFDAALDGVARAHRLPDADRVAGDWGAFGLLDATLRLLRAARERGPFDRYVLLSGADYPVRSVETIEQTLLGTDAEFLALERDLTAPEHRKRAGWIRRWHVPALNRVALARRLRLASRLGYALPRRRFPDGLRPWHGSQWWALTDAAAAQVLDFVDARPDALTFFRHAHHPEELFFQSVLAASPLAERCTSLAPGDPFVFGVHYVDWRTLTPSPPVLTLDDLPRIRATDALFARKMQAGVSDALLDALDGV